MEIITKNITYAVPDVYLTTDIAEGKTATVEYTGPDEMYVFVRKDTGLLDWSMHALPNLDASIQELARTHAGQSHEAVLVTIDSNPLICYAMFGEYDYDNAAQTEFKLDGVDEAYFTHPDPLPPQMVYDFNNFQFVFANASWKTPYPMQTADWGIEAIETMIASSLANIDELIADPEISEEYTDALNAAKAEIEKVIPTYGPDGANVPYWMWPMPEVPEVYDPRAGEKGEEPGEDWSPAEDGSEGAGPDTGYRPVNLDTAMLPEDSDPDTKPAPESDEAPTE
jgi:hypothetical protein